MATELVVKLRVSGDKDVDAALKRVGQAAQDAGVKLTPMNQGLGRASEQSRVALRAMGDLAQTLAGTSALLSVVSRGNKELQQTFEKVTVALTLTSTGLNVLRNAAQLTQGAMVALRVASVALGGALPILAVAALAAGLGVLIVRKIEATRAAEAHKRALENAGTATERFERSVAASAETAKAAGFIYSQLTSTVEHFSRLVRESAGAIQGLALETKRLLGADLPSFRDLGQEAKDAAAAAKQLREEFERLEEIENATNDLLLADAAMQQAGDGSKRLAESLRGVVLEARDVDRVARELAEDALPLVSLANQQAIEAIEAHMEAQRQLAVEVDATNQKLQQETDALINLANQQAVEAIEAHMQTQRQMAEAADKTLSAWEHAAAGIRGSFGEAFASIASGAESLTDVLRNLINSFLGALGQQIGIAAFGALFPQFAPAPAGRQQGGRFEAFQALRVGEAGPELAVFGHSGTIIPNRDLRGAGGAVVINVDARGAERGVSAEVRRAIRAMGDEAVQQSVAAVIDGTQRGGAMRRRLQR